MKCAIFEEHSSSCVVYFRFSGRLFPVSMIDGDICKPICCLHLFFTYFAMNHTNLPQNCHSGLENTRFRPQSQGGCDICILNSGFILTGQIMNFHANALYN